MCLCCGCSPRSCCACSDLCAWSGGNDPFLCSNATEEHLSLAEDGFGPVNTINLQVGAASRFLCDVVTSQCACATCLIYLCCCFTEFASVNSTPIFRTILSKAFASTTHHQSTLPAAAAPQIECYKLTMRLQEHTVRFRLYLYRFGRDARSARSHSESKFCRM